MSLDSKEPVSILLSGVPSSGKTMFLPSLMKLDSSYFIDRGNNSKAGVIDYTFDNKPLFQIHFHLCKNKHSIIWSASYSFLLIGPHLNHFWLWPFFYVC
jgi:tRNA uridine 5-carbamoylmethylation protein Kti12